MAPLTVEMSALWAARVSDFSTGIARLLIWRDLESLALAVAFTVVMAPPETWIVTCTLPNLLVDAVPV